MTDTLVLRTLAVPQSIAEIESFLEHVCSTIHKVPADALLKLQIAVSEIVANIIEHATKGLSRLVQIEMQIQVLMDEVHIRFTDDGHPFDTQQLMTDMPGGLADRGRGLAMARVVLADLGYERMDERNHWTLVSHRF